MILGGGRDVLLHGQEGEEGFDFGSARLGRVPHVVEGILAFDPAHVGLIGARGVMFEENGISDIIQQFLGAVLFDGQTPAFGRKGILLHHMDVGGLHLKPDCRVKATTYYGQDWA